MVHAPSPVSHSPRGASRKSKRRMLFYMRRCICVFSAVILAVQSQFWGHFLFRRLTAASVFSSETQLSATIAPTPQSKRFLSQLEARLRLNCSSGENGIKFDDVLLPSVKMSRVTCLNSQPAPSWRTVVTTADSTGAFTLPVIAQYLEAHHSEPINLIILAVDVTPMLIKSLCSRESTNLHIEFFCTTSGTLQSVYKYTRHGEGSANIIRHVPVATMYRLLLPEILPKSYDTVLYIDNDVIIKTDLTDLFQAKPCTPAKAESAPLGRCGICAKSSLKNNLDEWILPSAKCTFRLPTPPAKMRQFNAGVMVLSLAALRKAGISHISIVLSSVFNLNDQSIFNLYANETFGELNPAYNVYYGQDHDQIPINEQKILHSAGTNKSWYFWHPWYSLWLNSTEPGFLFVWTKLAEPFPDHARHSVQSAMEHSGGRPVTVLCMTLACYDGCKSLGYPAQVRMLAVRHFLNANSPASVWLRNHTIHKILLGKRFPEMFDRVVVLSALYEHGGMALDFDTSVHAEPSPAHFVSPWCKHLEGQQQMPMFAPQGHHVVLEAINKAVGGASSSLNSCPFTAASSAEMHLPDLTWASFRRSKGLNAAQPLRPSFGVLWYDARTRYLASTGNPGVNLGDEVQGLAGAQWLPYVNYHVERDDLGNITSPPPLGGQITVFMNAWYGTQSMVWPPPKVIDPILLSVHVEPKVYDTFSTPESVAFLKSRSPVGARDEATKKLFGSLGIDTFLSFCMTTTLQDLVSSKPRGCRVLLVDVSPKVMAFLPRSVLESSCNASAKWLDGGSGERFFGSLRYKKSFELLQTYAHSSIIITSRLHCALPAASMGRPVILVLSSSLPGGGGSKDGFQRFRGLDRLVHTVNLEEKENVANFFNEFNWNSPLSNPGQEELQEIRCRLIDYISSRGHQAIIDSWFVFSFSTNMLHCDAHQKYPFL